MKKFLICIFLLSTGFAHAYTPYHYNYNINHNWQPLVASIVLGTILNRSGIVYSQPSFSLQYNPRFYYHVPSLVNYIPRTYYYNTVSSCRYAESRDFHGNVVSFVQCH